MLAVTFLAATPAIAGHEKIERLAALLRQYEGIAAKGGWPTTPGGPVIRPHSSDSRLPTLALRLDITRDIAVDPELDLATYDGALLAAVEHFQRRHGLEADGIVGRATLAALNVSASARVRQIRTNIARLKFEARPVADSYLQVNIPAFRADLLQNHEVVWSTRVIVGEACNETPVFDTEMTGIVLNPEWTVPRSISTEELLPKIKADPDFLLRGGYELRASDGRVARPGDVDWERLNRSVFPFTIVQRPGPQNQLGRIKFVTPNEFSIYLHDTPAKHLFENASRTYSHGCIRVQHPFELASRALAGSEWSRARLVEAAASKHTRNIALQEPIPVFVVYRTVEVDDAGLAYFYNDIYERDTGIPGGTQPGQD